MYSLLIKPFWPKSLLALSLFLYIFFCHSSLLILNHQSFATLQTTINPTLLSLTWEAKSNFVNWSNINKFKSLMSLTIPIGWRRWRRDRTMFTSTEPLFYHCYVPDLQSRTWPVRLNWIKKINKLILCLPKLAALVRSNAAKRSSAFPPPLPPR